ncbi:MAG TPA: hypothetical protein VH186_35920 [Chloroflexia bacterium]|nr:hypothetical protein [Chloroflexia bacterium]
MQPVLVTTRYRDLYHFLLGLAEESHAYQRELKAQMMLDPEVRVVIWSPETRSSLLDEPDKLEIVDRHARKLGVKIVLSAASDFRLREWAAEKGWTIMWEIPSMEKAMEQVIREQQFDKASSPD